MNVPKSMMLNGKQHTLCLFAVRARFADGTPQTLQRIRPTDRVKLSEEGEEENEFMTAYAPEAVVGPAE